LRIQIADDDGQVLHVPALNKDLERDLRALFPTYPKRCFLKNRRTRHALAAIDAAVWALRLETRHSVG
jgi:hypothetical protein